MQAAKQGYRGLLSHGYYLDAMAPASEHYQVDPLPNAGFGGTSAHPRRRGMHVGRVRRW